MGKGRLNVVSRKGNKSGHVKVDNKDKEVKKRFKIKKPEALEKKLEAQKIKVGDEDSDIDEVIESGGYFEIAKDEAVTADEEQLLNQFLNPNPQKQQTLADMILDKIKEKEQLASMGENPETQTIDPKVVQVYKKIGVLMSRYSSGSLAKAFKVIPSLRNWEEILHLTAPENWSPGGMEAATKIFCSNLNPKMAQRYYNLVLLPSIRNNIDEKRKLNIHYYEALKKAMYKPAAWFKGILIPLCEAGDCSMREAVILGSILSKISIPLIHGSAALLKISQMPYAGPTNYFIKVLLNKKYALPQKVLDTVIDYFYQMADETRQLPVLWHQTLLILAQRYKNDINNIHKEKLKHVLRAHAHPIISEEIRKELFSFGGGAPRGMETD
mmetsp:Transcript_53691/g.61539  ORF Transcript_53691/g.61539 Transcript_53691/m.61539 type:complete len:383 (-) Transcript_53691:302-1450(-)